jgi:putative methylase
MKLRHLEMELERLRGFAAPDVKLEQYQTPATVAARLLFHAHLQGDISGTGILACGAALLGASPVAGIDLDPSALAIAGENAGLLGVRVAFIAGDVRDSGVRRAICPCDTVVMNPPFGAQNRHADRPFLDTALECGRIVWGIFNAGSLPFLRSYTAGRAEIGTMISCRFPIRHTFAHHRKERMEIPVEIVRLRTIRDV